MAMKTILFVLLGVAASAQEEKVENDARFHPLLSSVAKSYEKYAKVGDTPRVAPGLCAGPPPPGVLLSSSKDGSTHGQKLYFLFALDPELYRIKGKGLRATAPLAPVYGEKGAEQALVKQSWTCVPADKEKDADLSPLLVLRKGDQLFKTGEKKDLFIMVKLDTITEGTDHGWVYGTVTPDGKTVTSSGKVRSCIECHKTAGDCRLFGLPAAEKK